jgi:creatinine amidohydrolase
VATRLNREWAAAPVRVHAVGDYYRASQDEFRQLLKARGYREDELGSHASLADTALMLAVDPRLVRMDRLRPGTGPTGDGVDGDPSRASAELGRLGVEAIVARTVSAVKTAIARP